MSLNVHPMLGMRAPPQFVMQPLPSGQDVELFEVLVDAVGAETWVRFRFLAPHIGKVGGGLSFAEIEQDFPHLCVQIVLPYLEDVDLHPDVVVISLLDRPFDFGTTDAEATQFIEAFRVSGGDCAWEVF